MATQLQTAQETVHLTVVRPFSIGGQIAPEGAVVEVDEAEALDLLNRGLAEPAVWLRPAPEDTTGGTVTESTDPAKAEQPATETGEKAEELVKE